MKYNLFLITFILFSQLAYPKGIVNNIIDNFASNTATRLSDPYNENIDTSEYTNEYKKLNIYSNGEKFAIGFIILLILLLSPYRSRFYFSKQFRREITIDNTPIGVVALKNIFSAFITTTEKSFYSFKEEEIIERENEVKNLLFKINISYDEIIKYSEKAFKEYILFWQGEKNDLEKISMKSFHLKYIKEMSEFYQNEIKSIIEEVKINDIKIINLRYTESEKAFTSLIKYNSKQYLVGKIEKNFISGDRNAIERYMFMTFVYNNGWKLSLIEYKGESYTMKLKNIVTLEGEKPLLNNFKEKTISKTNVQLKIAESFFNLYSFWQKPEEDIKINIEENLKSKIYTERKKILMDKTIDFKIKKVIVTKMEFLEKENDFFNNFKKIIVRIIFIMQGSFSKNGIIIINDSEIMLDEIWEFKIENERVILVDILKKFTKETNSIDVIPLQIEWYR